MRLLHFWVLCLCAATIAHGFRDTSPFFCFSTSQIKLENAFDEQLQIALGVDVSNRIQASLSSCPSDAYVIVNQPGVHARDFAGKNAAPHMRRKVQKEDIRTKSSTTIPDVLGNVETEHVKRFLEHTCGAGSVALDASRGYIVSDDTYPQIIEINMPNLPSSREARALTLAENDSFLNAVINNLQEHSYTVLFTTTPSSDAEEDSSETQQHPMRHWNYDAEAPFPSPLHTDLKRDLEAHIRAPSNSTRQRSPPLFEKYNFLSAGLFMGIFVMIILFSILYVGISAISGIEVSYGSFSKEMGVSAQKNKQQ